MNQSKNTIFEQFVLPVFKNLLIDQEAFKETYSSIDWQKECDRLTNPNLVYPDYYATQNFHGIKGGYLTPEAAITYDTVTQYALPPNETLVRQGLINAIQGQPRRILDLGCGTGSTTLMLKRAFPQAEVVGLDLSPYLLIMAEKKFQKAGVNIKICHSNAEQTGFADGFFDLVAISFLFHETPMLITSKILKECFRLLQPGGQVVILDGNQKNLRQNRWIMEIFEEPYVHTYADGNLDAELGRAGFEQVKTEDWWWINQMSWGMKPIAHSNWVVSSEQTQSRYSQNRGDFSGFPTPA